MLFMSSPNPTQPEEEYGNPALSEESLTDNEISEVIESEAENEII